MFLPSIWRDAEAPGERICSDTLPFACAEIVLFFDKIILFFPIAGTHVLRRIKNRDRVLVFMRIVFGGLGNNEETLFSGGMTRFWLADWMSPKFGPDWIVIFLTVSLLNCLRF